MVNVRSTHLLLSLKRSLLIVLLLSIRDGGLLVLLVLRNQIVHVGLGLSELHLVHTLTSVPMQESLAPEHGSELVTDTLEQLLDGGGVTDKGGGHLEATRRNRAESSLDVVGDPLNKVGRVLVLDVAHLVLNLLHGDLSAEVSGAGQVTTIAEVRGSHHVLGVEHLLGELRNGDSAERVGATAGKRSESNHEEMETREGDHVDSQLPEIGVELTRETQAGGDTRHDGGDEVVQVTVGGVVQLEGPHANVVQSLVVNTEGLVRVLNELVDGQGGVVRLNNGIRDLGGRHNGESGHHAVRELLTDLGDQEGTHTGTGTTTKGVGDLETLEAVAAFSLTADNIEDLVDQLGTLSVMALCPVVTSTRLAKNEVVGTEQLSERSSADSVHCAGLEIDENSAGHKFVARCLPRVSA